MSYFDGRRSWVTREASLYPDLMALLGGYFNQDFHYIGETLEEILAVYRRDASKAELGQTISDIHRFLADYGQSDASLAEAFQRIFKPDVIIEGWEGLTGRQWLQQVARLLS